MTHPLLKKNPFLSLWLSAANSVAGTARGHASASARRQANDAMAQANRAVFDFWATTLGAKPQRRAKRKAKR